jgi:hypothetical protein
MPAQHRQVMTQKQDLELLRATRTRQQPHQREQIPRHQIRERPEQADPPSTDGKSPEPSQPDAHQAPGTSLRTLRARGGAYVFRGRLATTQLVKGRTYLVRLKAIDAGGNVRQLTFRART